MRQRLLLWLLLGLLTRFFLMPIAFHGDLVLVYWRSAAIAYHGDLTPITIPGEAGSVQPGAHFIHAAWLEILKVIGIDLSNIFLQGNADTDGPTRTIIFWLRQARLPRILFLLKSLYLIFDLASGLLLLHLLSGDPRKGLLAFQFWMINPLGLYATYCFSRYEVIPIFFTLLSLWLVKQNRRNWAALIVGLAITTRFYPLLLVVPMVLTCNRGWCDHLRHAALSLAPPLILQALIGALSPSTGGASSSIGAMTRFPHLSYLFGFRLRVAGQDNVYIFPLLYILFLFYLANRQVTSQDRAWSILSKWFLVTMAIFFATCHFHPQYLAWIVPLIVLQAVGDGRLWWLHAIQIVCFYFYALQFGEQVLGGLFRPWPSLGVLGNPTPVLTKFLTTEQIASIARSILSATLAYMAYLAYKSEEQTGVVV